MINQTVFKGRGHKLDAIYSPEELGYLSKLMNT